MLHFSRVTTHDLHGDRQGVSQVIPLSLLTYDKTATEQLDRRLADGTDHCAGSVTYQIYRVGQLK